MSIFCLAAQASNWQFTWIGNNETRYFFDAATVEKSNDSSVLIWVKTVQVTTPDSNDVWAMAIHWKINCKRRTLQTLAWSTYNKTGDFIRGNTSPTAEQSAIPDSTGEAMLNLACKVDFPNNKSGDDYFSIANNDVFLAVKTWNEIRLQSIDVAPK